MKLQQTLQIQNICNSQLLQGGYLHPLNARYHPSINEISMSNCHRNRCPNVAHDNLVLVLYLIDGVLVFAGCPVVQRTADPRCPRLLEDIVEAVPRHLPRVTLLHQAHRIRGRG